MIGRTEGKGGRGRAGREEGKAGGRAELLLVAACFSRSVPKNKA